MKRLADLSAAFALLTRLPLGGLAGQADFARAVWAYPLVGGVVGLLGGGVYWLASLAMPPFLAAFWTLAALVLITGGLHEDGLADTADGFGGGRTRERKLEIMRDSRIGSFGAIALILSLLLRGTALALIAGALPVALALMAAGSLGRLAILVVLASAPPARKDGMAAGLAGVPTASLIAGTAIAVLLALIQPWPRALLAIGVTVVAGLAVARLAKRQIGGHTGDVLGAAALVAECLVLSVLAGR